MKKLMVVDDEDMIRDLIKKLFNLRGYEVVCAESGKRCLEELKKGFRGVILMDIMMPGMDGWDTIQAMADGGLLKGNVICAFTTKDLEDAEKARRLSHYVSEFLQKPVDTTLLMEIVNNHSS